MHRSVVAAFNADYARKRSLELRLQDVVEFAEPSGGANVSEWERLARMFPSTVQRGGQRLVD